MWSKLCNGKQGGSGCGQNYVRWVWSKLCNGNKVGVVKISNGKQDGCGQNYIMKLCMTSLCTSCDFKYCHVVAGSGAEQRVPSPVHSIPWGQCHHDH